MDSYQQDGCGLRRMRVGSLFDSVTVLVPILIDKKSHQIDLQYQLHLIEGDVDLDSEGGAETPVSEGGDSASAGNSAPGVDPQACSWSADDSLFISIMFLCWSTPAHKTTLPCKKRYSS